MDASESTLTISDYIENARLDVGDGLPFDQFVRLLGRYATQVITALSETTLEPMGERRYLMLQPSWITPQLTPVPETVAKVRAIDVMDGQTSDGTVYVYLTRDGEWLQATRTNDGPDDSYNIAFRTITTEQCAHVAMALSRGSEIVALRSVLIGLTKAMDDRLARMQARYDRVALKKRSLEGVVLRIESLS